MHRTLYALPFILCSALFGCAAQEESFAEGYPSEMRYDCEQSVACRSGRGESLSAMPIPDCIAASTKRLDGFDKDRRQLWLDTFARCAAFQGCDYYDCTQSDQAYSMAHAAEIQYDCTSRVSCRNSRGEMLGTEVIEQCITQSSAALDIAEPSEQTTFEMRFARCKMMQQCAYLDCP